MMDSSAQLVAVVRGRDGTELSDRVVQWTVDRNEIAFVSDHGVVTGLSPGRATVTATVEGVTDQVTVTVRRGRETVANRTTGVVIEPVKPRLRVGETFQVRALVNGAERPAVWRSADSNIAAISSTGLITGVSQSVTTITATIGSTVSRASLVIVDPKPVAIVAPLAPPPAPPTAPISETTPAAGTTFLLDQSSYTIEIGDSIRLHAFIRQGWERTERGATWSSSDSSVVAVGSQSGWARGVSLGSAVVTAVAEDRRSVAAPVKVSPRGTANGVLKLRVGPGKGDITVDNVHHGLYSRFDVPLTPYVKHVITIARTGYVTVDTTITLRSGQERIIAITLKRAQP